MNSQERFEARRLLPGMAKRLREASVRSNMKPHKREHRMIIYYPWWLKSMIANTESLEAKMKKEADIKLISTGSLLGNSISIQDGGRAAVGAVPPALHVCMKCSWIT